MAGNSIFVYPGSRTLGSIDIAGNLTMNGSQGSGSANVNLDRDDSKIRIGVDRDVILSRDASGNLKVTNLGDDGATAGPYTTITAINVKGGIVTTLTGS